MQERKVSQASNLFSPAEVGPLRLKNRAVMAPLTRSRAGLGNVPTQLNALYYAQRATAGLIIAEATQIAPEGQGYISTPGIHIAEQVEGWKLVTELIGVSERSVLRAERSPEPRGKALEGFQRLQDRLLEGRLDIRPVLRRRWGPAGPRKRRKPKKRQRPDIHLGKRQARTGQRCDRKTS